MTRSNTSSKLGSEMKRMRSKKRSFGALIDDHEWSNLPDFPANFENNSFDHTRSRGSIDNN